MGRSDVSLKPVYAKLIKVIQNHFQQHITVAVLGSPSAYFVSDMLANATCEFFDLQLHNWDINTDWNLGKKYDVILSTRCPYFAKYPQIFVEKCHAHLESGGAVLLDWGYGDHWRFSDYKIGWAKDNEQEYCYGKTNYLWSGVWDDSFLDNCQFQKFAKWVQKLGYKDVKEAIFTETPTVLPLMCINSYFDTQVELLALWEDCPQLYVFIVGFKKIV